MMKKIILTLVAMIFWIMSLVAVCYVLFLVFRMRVPPCFKEAYFDMTTIAIPAVVILAGEILQFLRRARVVGGLLVAIGCGLLIVMSMAHDFLTSSDNTSAIVLGILCIVMHGIAHSVASIAYPMNTNQWIPFS